MQLSWTGLPQGFKNSPTLFGNQLAKELEQWQQPLGDGVLLQYGDDLLIATETEEECVQRTISLVNFLGLSGYRVSQQKAQLVQEKAAYLGYEVSAGQRSLGRTRKEAVCQTPRLETVRDLRTFPGTTGSCRLWMYQYGLPAKPLSDPLSTTRINITWTPETDKAFKAEMRRQGESPRAGASLSPPALVQPSLPPRVHSRLAQACWRPW